MSKIFRVFFSSTFSDLVEERNALQKEVFPKLKELCAAHGTRFQPIDLRWGIPDEVALQQSTMQICLEEIKRCQNLTPRPNFLVLLGERYGWTPPSVKIPKTEYDLISAHFSEEDKTLIKEWYRLDENELCKLDDGTITSVYELQPRGEEYESYEKWEPIEIRLRNSLLQAARKASLSEKEMVKYFASATHQEIVMGALKTHEEDTHVHCFFRKLNGLPEGAKPDVYLESGAEGIKFLSNLKEELEHQLPLNIHRYKIDLGDEKEKEKYLEKFCNDVYHSLETTILQELEEMEEISALDEEINAHYEFGKNRTKVFIGREEILNDIIDYVESDNRAPFVIYGEPGSGKSALMAKALEKLEKESIDAEYLVRFIGITPSSSDSIALIRSICEQIINKFEIEFEEEIPFEYNEIKETFNKLLGLIQGGERAVILLDALDQLPRKDKGRDLAWLPQEIPENVKLITSFTTDDGDIMSTLKKKLPSSLRELKRLSLEEGDKALDILLENALRRLTPHQKDMILQKFSENGLPLYLKLGFEEASTWNSYSKISSIKLASDVEGLIKILFERLYSEHTRETVERILSYLAVARNGLTEDEILEIMTSDSVYFEWYKNQIHHDLHEERLPWIVWSRLYFDLEPYLTTRGVDHTSTIVFFHRQFNEAVKKNLSSKAAEDCHQVIANYFNSADLYYQKNGTKTPNYRKLSELVYHLRKAKMWRNLENYLTSLEFIEAKCTAGMTEDLLIDYHRSLDDVSSKDVSNEIRSHIQDFKQFVFNQAHILRKYPQLVVQQAINQPDNTLPSNAGKVIKNKELSRPWIEWINKPQERDPCILTIPDWRIVGKIFSPNFSPDGTKLLLLFHIKELILRDVETGTGIRAFTGHSISVEAGSFSPDGTKVVSASMDKTLKLWDVETGVEIRTFMGHTGSVNACAFSPDGTIMASASWDKTLKLWNVETGVEIRTLKGHFDSLQSCAFSSDGKMVVSASIDKTLKLWDVEIGTEIRTFMGHAFSVNGCAFSPDSTKVVSSSYDKTLKLWDVETGNEIRTFRGHTASVNGCAFSPDGTRIISASSDKTLKLWDVETGTEIRTFTGHSDSVVGCAFSPNSMKVVSTSEHESKLWDVETKAEIRAFTGHSGPVKECVLSPDCTKMVSAGDMILKLWDMKTGTEIRTFTGHSGGVRGCAFSPDGKKVVSASSDTTLKLWEVETGIEIRTFTGHYFPVITCVFSSDGTKLNSAASNGTLKLWDEETGAEIRTLNNYSYRLVFSPDVTKVVAALGDYRLKLWDVETGTEIRTFKGHSSLANVCSFSPDGTKLISSSYDKTLKLWDLETGNEISLIGHSYLVNACSFSPDGIKVISVSWDRTLKLWDVATGTEIRTFTGHSASVEGCAFSPDGKKLASVSRDKTLKLWDVKNGNELMTFPTLGETTHVVFGVNGKIVAGDKAGKVYILSPHGIDLASNPQK